MAIKGTEYVSPRKSSQATEIIDNGKFKKYKCSCCGEDTNDINKFPKVKSELFKGWGNRFSICSACLDKIFEHYVDAYGTRCKALQRICMMTDSYFDPVMYESVDKATDGGRSSSIVRMYFQKLGLIQYKKKTYDTYLEETGINAIDIRTIQEKIDDGDSKITKAAIGRWGVGKFSEEDYETLEDHYQMLKDNNPNVDSNQEIFIKNLCNLHLLMTKALGNEDTDKFIKASDQYAKIFTKAGLKTIEEKDSSVDETLGVTLATISRFTPEEYYADKKRYADFDGIGDYFKRFILRPLKNLQLGTTERDKEFKVKEED